MIKDSTLNAEQLFDESFVKEIRDAFRCETQTPSSKVLRFIRDFAAAYDAVDTRMMGVAEVMNN